MSIGKNWCLDVVRWYVSRSVLRLMKSLLICTWPSTYRLPNSRLAAISRQFVGKSARKASLGFWVHNWMNGTCFERQWTKESNKTKFDSYNVRNSVLIISHITFRDCRVHILLSPWAACGWLLPREGWLVDEEVRWAVAVYQSHGHGHHQTYNGTGRRLEVLYHFVGGGLASPYNKQLFLTHWWFIHSQLLAFTILSLVI